MLERAEELGLMTGGEFRERLGLPYTAFVAAVGGGRVPKPVAELPGGDAFWKRDDAERFLMLLGK